MISAVTIAAQNHLGSIHPYDPLRTDLEEAREVPKHRPTSSFREVELEDGSDLLEVEALWVRIVGLQREIVVAWGSCTTRLAKH